MGATGEMVDMVIGMAMRTAVHVFLRLRDKPLTPRQNRRQLAAQTASRAAAAVKMDAEARVEAEQDPVENQGRRGGEDWLKRWECAVASADGRRNKALRSPEAPLIPAR